MGPCVLKVGREGLLQQLSVFVNKQLSAVSQTHCSDKGCAWFALQRDLWLSSSGGKWPLVGRVGMETLPYWEGYQWNKEIEKKKSLQLEDIFIISFCNLSFPAPACRRHRMGWWVGVRQNANLWLLHCWRHLLVFSETRSCSNRDSMDLQLCFGELTQSSLHCSSNDLGWPEEEDCHWDRIFYRSQSS